MHQPYIASATALPILSSKNLIPQNIISTSYTYTSAHELVHKLIFLISWTYYSFASQTIFYECDKSK